MLLLGSIPGYSKSYSADRCDVRVEVKPDAGVLVTESMRFRFTGGPFTYVFRDLPLRAVDDIRDIETTVDGMPDQAEIRHGNPIRVRWVFSPVSDTMKTFTLRYRVLGVMQPGDTLSWHALPTRRDYRISSCRIELFYPDGHRPVSASVGRSRPEESADGLAFELSGIDDEKDLVLHAVFPAGSLVRETPVWQRAGAEQRRLFLKGMTEGVVLSAVIVLLLSLLVLRLRPPAHGAAPPAMPCSEPPDGTPPAMAARLLGHLDTTASQATLYDLARRGFLRIEPASKSRWTGREFVAIRTGGGSGTLAGHESALLSVFESGKVKLSEFAFRVGGSFSKALHRDMVAAGLLDEERQRSRRSILAVALVTLTAGVAIVVLGLVSKKGSPEFAGGLLSAGLGAVVAGFVALIAGALISPLPAVGAAAASRWRGFASFLKRMFTSEVLR